MQVALVENAHTYGVLDPQMRERRDTKFLKNSLEDARNIIVLPQGGYVDRGGSTDKGKIRHKMAAPVSVPTTSFPSGHSTVDGREVTNTISVWPATIVSIAFAAHVGISAYELTELTLEPASASANPEAGSIKCEVLIASVWEQFGEVLTISNRLKRGASFALPPGSTPLAVDGIRVIVSGVAQNSKVSWLTKAYLAETDEISTARSIPFNRGADRYKLIFTDQHLDVFKKGVWVGGSPFPLAEDSVRRIKPASKFDTVVAFHEDMHPQAIRRFDDNDWSASNAPFTNIPRYDYGGVYTNGVNEKQIVTLFGVANGKTFDLIVNGNTTPLIVCDSNTTTTAANIKAGLEATAGVNDGVTVTYVSGSIGTDSAFRVEFSGENNKARPWPKMEGSTPVTSGAVTVQREVIGKIGGEDVFSEDRGFPTCGKFVQQRLVYAGMSGVPNGFGASKTGDPFNLDIETGGATAGFLYEVEMEEVSQILDIYAEQGVVVLTGKSVHSLANTTLSAAEAPDWRTGMAPGVRPECPIIRSDTTILYCEGGGQDLQALGYTDAVKNYVGSSASVLSAFLIDQPVGAARRGPTRLVSADVLFYVMSSGTLVTLTSMLAQDVSGFTPHLTPGAFHDVCVDGDGDVWWIADRDEDGTTERRLELMDPLSILDAAVEQSYPDGTTVISGLERFNGKEVWALLDDAVIEGPLPVADGEAVIETMAQAVRVGLWEPPFAKDPPVDLSGESQRPMPHQKRINEIRLSLLATSSVAVAANDGELVNIPLQFFDEAHFDETTFEQRYTGVLPLEGWPGFTPDCQARVSQLFPGKLNVRGLTKNIVA